MHYPDHTPLMQRSDPQHDLTSRVFIEVRAETVNESERSVEAVMATEQPVMVYDWRSGGRVWEILLMSGVEIPKTRQVPMLDTHSLYSVSHQLGSTRKIRVETNGEEQQLVGVNVFGSNTAGEDAWQLAREGHLTDNSVGYRVLKPVTIPAGETVTVDGRDFTAPKDMALRVVTEWSVRENSCCPIGADDMAKHRSDGTKPIETAARTSQSPLWKDKTMFETVEEYYREVCGLDFADVPEGKRASIQARFDAAMAARAVIAEGAAPLIPPAATPAAEAAPAARAAADEAPTAADELRAANVAEGTRKLSIRASARTVLAKVAETSHLDASEFQDTMRASIESCIDGNMTAERAELQIQQDLNGRALALIQDRPTFALGGMAGQTDEQRQNAVESSLAIRSGRFSEEEIVSMYGERSANEGDSRQLRERSLMEMAEVWDREHEARTGVRGIGDLATRATSTGGLASTFSSLANRSVQKGYNDIMTTLGWCSTGTTNDFRTRTRFSIYANGAVEEVKGPKGEVKTHGIGEQTTTIDLKSYSGNMGITRMDIINDDKDVFTKLPMLLGRRLAMQVPKVTYTLLLTNPQIFGADMFSTARGNLLLSTSLDAAAVGAAIKAMRMQTGPDGEPIDVNPETLLVSPTLVQTQKSLINSSQIIAIDMAAAANKQKGSSNTLQTYNLKPLDEPRLETPSYTGYDDSWAFVIANPNDAPTFEIMYLNGIQVPTMAPVYHPGPDVQHGGLVYQSTIDFGVAPMDYRGMVAINDNATWPS